MASKFQDVDDVPRWAGEDADVNAIYESWKNRSENVAQLTAYTFQEWKENNAGEFDEVDCVCCLDVIEEIFDVKAKATRVPNRPGGSD